MIAPVSQEGTHAEPELAPVLAPPGPAGPGPVTGLPSGLGAAVMGVGTMTPGHVLALQRSAGNGAVANLLARQPTAAPPAPAGPQSAPASGAFTVEVPEEWLDGLKLEGGKANWFKGSLAVKGEVQFVAVDPGQDPSKTTAGGSTGAKGVKVETERKGETWVSNLLDSMGFDEVTESLTGELGAKKLELSAGVQGKIKTSVPWFTPIVEGKVIGIGVEWAKLAETTVGGIELSGGGAGEGRVSLDGIDFIVKPKVTITGKGELNMARVAAEVAKHTVTEGGKLALKVAGGEAGTVIALDAGAIAAGAAAIIVPAAAAVALGFGFFQGMKNAAAAREAAEKGVEARRQAVSFARSYAKVLTGGKGDDPFAVASAETQISTLMATTGAPRAMVIAMIVDEQGGYSAIFKKNLKIIKDKLYDKAVETFNETHKDDFGLVESLGDDWGMKGVFQSTLRIVLYGGEDDAP
jgi:hypothetical protein